MGNSCNFNTGFENFLFPSKCVMFSASFKSNLKFAIILYMLSTKIICKGLHIPVHVS